MQESHLDFYLRWNKLAQPYFEWQYLQFKPYIGNRVADIGCGPGNLTSFLADKDLYLGVDLDKELLKCIEAHHMVNNINTLIFNVEDESITTVLREKNIDTILCLNLIEHLADDSLALKNMIEALPMNGNLCLLVPAFPCLYGSLDKLDGHFRRYTKKSVQDSLKPFSVTIKKLYYFNLIGALGWYWKGKIIKESTHKNENYLIMNKLIPLFKKVECFSSPPFGLSIVCVAQKNKVF